MNKFGPGTNRTSLLKSILMIKNTYSAKAYYKILYLSQTSENYADILY